MASQITGRNWKIVERGSKSLQESPSQEVKTKMALHSEVQAEESHKEQGEYAERLGGRDTPTWQRRRNVGIPWSIAGTYNNNNETAHHP